ncbi:dUTP pyrophosphatase [Staphylococcus saprophyticus]|nr:dUTP pyrophosphatase [Staphylococcus saprophyticus]
MSETLKVKLLSENATKPKRNYDTDAGYDIYAAETKILKPQEKAIIQTDVAVDIPNGYVGLLTSRSGVSSKTHLVIETGKIDSGFRNGMGINVKNDEQRLDWEREMNNNELEKGYEPLVYDIKGEKVENGNPFCAATSRKHLIQKGDKLAQLVIVPIFTGEVELVDDFTDETERGTKGFGSSGTR